MNAKEWEAAEDIAAIIGDALSREACELSMHRERHVLLVQRGDGPGLVVRVSPLHDPVPFPRRPTGECP